MFLQKSNLSQRYRRRFEGFWDFTPCRLVVTETFRTFKMSENIYQSTRRNNLEDWAASKPALHQGFQST